MSTAIIPAFTERNIPVVFSADETYAPYLGVTLQSLVEHASSEFNYDILILDGGILPEMKRTLASILPGGSQHFSLRYIDMQEYREELDKLFVDRHLSSATYYRLILSSLLEDYDSVLYLDCDLLVMDDLALLYRCDLEGYLVAGVKEIATYWIDPSWHQEWHQSIVEQGVENPLHSFNAGVLLMNLKAFREIKLERRLLDLARNNRFIQHDQDVLNIACENRWQLLPGEWNYQYHQCAPYEFSEETSRQEQTIMDEPASYRIVHYIRDQKPWSHPDKPLAPLWWEYARRSPFYAVLRAGAPGRGVLRGRWFVHGIAAGVAGLCAKVSPPSLRRRFSRKAEYSRKAARSLRAFLAITR